MVHRGKRKSDGLSVAIKVRLVLLGKKTMGAALLRRIFCLLAADRDLGQQRARCGHLGNEVNQHPQYRRDISRTE